MRRVSLVESKIVLLKAMKKKRRHIGKKYVTLSERTSICRAGKNFFAPSGEADAWPSASPPLRATTGGRPLARRIGPTTSMRCRERRCRADDETIDPQAPPHRG